MSDSPKKTRVALIFGGRSGEHQISCATAASVMAVIDPARYEILAIGITPDGEWVRVPAKPELYEMIDGRGVVIEAGESSVALWAGNPRVVEKPLAVAGERIEATDLGDVDVVFPLLHGPYGEDGTIQGLMEMSNVRYVGCGVAASAVSNDKHVTKALLLGAGISVGRWTLITDREWRRDRSRALAQAASVGQDLYVKPARAGSSLGITHVEDLDMLEDAIEEARKVDPRVIVEAATVGREIECGVLDFGSEGARASRCGEIVVASRDGFYDYKTKYQAHDDVTLSTPADLPKAVEQQIRETAVRAFEVLGCEGLARVDFFYNEESGKITINEVNTMPGFTPWSMYPAMWQATGMEYPALVSHLIQQALARPLGLR